MAPDSTEHDGTMPALCKFSSDRTPKGMPECCCPEVLMENFDLTLV
jgi:hypothetical protein